MIRAHCHRVIKLSGTLGKFAPEKELVENVHGVRGRFLEIGKELRDTLLSEGGRKDPVFGPDAEPSVYFIGKMQVMNMSHVVVSFKSCTDRTFACSSLRPQALVEGTRISNGASKVCRR